jgi:hypothetical protein
MGSDAERRGRGRMITMVRDFGETAPENNLGASPLTSFWKDTNFLKNEKGFSTWAISRKYGIVPKPFF